jgi:hypothetical protein
MSQQTPSDAVNTTSTTSTTSSQPVKVASPLKLDSTPCLIRL